MPILDASSLIELSAEQHKKKTSWTVALVLLEYVMAFDPVATLRRKIEEGKHAEFCFFSYIDTTAHIDDWEKMTKCLYRSYHGRGTFKQFFNTSFNTSDYSCEVATDSEEQRALLHQPLGDILHRNSERSCSLTLLEEMLGPNFKVRSRYLHDVTKSPEYEDLGCHMCPAKWNRIGLFIEFTPHARPRNDYIHALWPNLETFNFVKPETSCLRIVNPITKKEGEWLAYTFAT